MCANWNGFHDAQSGITKYAIGAGSSPGATDIADLKELKKTVFEYCIALNETNTLIHDNVYYIVLWAYNGGINQLNTSVESDGGKRFVMSKFVSLNIKLHNNLCYLSLNFSVQFLGIYDTLRLNIDISYICIYI